MKKATNFFARKKISVYDLPQRRAQKDPKTSKAIILNLNKGYLWPTQKGPWAERPNCPAAGFWEMGAKGSIRGFCTSSLWLPNSLFFIGQTSPNLNFKIRKVSDFGAFQLPEVREFFFKKSPDFYIWSSVSRQKYKMMIKDCNFIFEL